MPVLGHAFVGITTAVCTRHRVRRDVGRALWLPALVGLAYLPDILAQLAKLAYVAPWRTVTHSLLFGVAASLVLASPLARLAGLPFRAGLLIAGLSIGLHQGLDVLQGTDGRPFWPFSHRHVDLPDGLFPSGLSREVLFFGCACGAVVGLWAVLRRRQPSPAAPPEPTSPRYRRLMWLGHATTAAVLLVAAGTHGLREMRERQLAQAWSLIRDHRPEEAFTFLEKADRWPYVGAGYTDYARAEAYERMGRRDQAEGCYLRSWNANPTNFWVTADLALFYASSSEPLEERRRKAAPYIARLRQQFPRRVELPGILERLDRKLADRPATRAAVPPPSRPAHPDG